MSKSKKNLYAETEEVLQSVGKTFDDILWLSGNGHEISKDDFLRIAKGFDYNNGFGGVEVPGDLMIVGEDWWMERCEYDGSEWWEFKRKPERPSKIKKTLNFDADEFGEGKYIYA